MTVLIIDNYDSFVFNLARYVKQLGFNTEVLRNDALTVEEVESLSPTHLILSPGPCGPDEAGICLELVQYFHDKIPILGVCLGHQVIAQAFGGSVERAQNPMHGKASGIKHNQQALFAGLPSPLKVGRYHSLIVSSHKFPPQLQITAESDRGEVMALQHRQYPVFGLQFHPESIMTDSGYELLQAFLV